MCLECFVYYLCLDKLQIFLSADEISLLHYLNFQTFILGVKLHYISQSQNPAHQVTSVLSLHVVCIITDKCTIFLAVLEAADKVVSLVEVFFHVLLLKFSVPSVWIIKTFNLP